MFNQCGDPDNYVFITDEELEKYIEEEMKHHDGDRDAAIDSMYKFAVNIIIM